MKTNFNEEVKDATSITVDVGITIPVVKDELMGLIGLGLNNNLIVQAYSVEDLAHVIKEFIGTKLKENNLTTTRIVLEINDEI